MPELTKEKWLAALRSGEYDQGIGMLEKNNQYCCLGVLQMVCDGKVERWEYDGSSRFLPSDAWYAGHKILDVCGSSCVPQRLSAMNDGSDEDNLPRHDFLQIADYIEKEVEAY
jgi:hypothetical protein